MINLLFTVFFEGVEADEIIERLQINEIDETEQSEESLPNSQEEKVEDKNSDEAFSREIIPGEETIIKIEKGSNGLGLSIVGGSDTLLVCIYYHYI